jgi:hypothetical protein
MTNSTKRSSHLFGTHPLPAVAKPLREQMKRTGLDLVHQGDHVEPDLYAVVPQTGGEAIYMSKLADVAAWNEKARPNNGEAGDMMTAVTE